jgi:hypothetical protein
MRSNYVSFRRRFKAILKMQLVTVVLRARLRR